MTIPAVHPDTEPAACEPNRAARPNYEAVPGCTIDFGGNALQLMPDGSVHEPRTGTLLVADPHLGKAERFRYLGVPVPDGPTAATLAALSNAVNRVSARRLIVLGDLVHGRLPDDHPLFGAITHWRGAHPHLQVQLVTGNHDRHAGGLPDRCGITPWHDDDSIGGLGLCHEPALADPDRFSLCGHLHPVIVLRSPVEALRLRCFWFQRRLGVLPAFGHFTGGMVINPGPDDRLAVTDGLSVHRLPAGFGTRRRSPR